MVESRAGAVGATLLCRDEEHEACFEHGYGVQHRGLELREEGDGMIHPSLRGWEADPLDGELGEDAEPPAIAAACLLIGCKLFERIGGFTHGYVYGPEDVDLSFKLRTAGWPVLCCGRSLAIHHPASTRRAAPFEEERARKRANRRLLWECWGPTLRREFELNRRWREEGDQAFSAPAPLGYCLKVGAPLGETTEQRSLAALHVALRERDRVCQLFCGNEVDDPRGLNYDVAVHLRGAARHIPKPAQINVLWAVSHHDAITATECFRYDLTVTEDEALGHRLRAEGLPVSAFARLGGANTSELMDSLIDAAEAHAREANLPDDLSLPAQ